MVVAQEQQMMDLHLEILPNRLLQTYLIIGTQRKAEEGGIQPIIPFQYPAVLVRVVEINLLPLAQGQDFQQMRLEGLEVTVLLLM